jgi:hypothetical protein
MRFLVDTCGWLEWLTDGVLANEFAPDNHFEGLPDVIYFSKKS